MIRRNLIPVWTGIILLSGMFLMGADTWLPNTPCNDLDGDGSGLFLSKNCSIPVIDCCEFDSGAYPGAPELCDGMDNQCSGDPGFMEVDEGCGPPHPTDMAQIPSGCYDMGDNLDELGTMSLPVHEVCLSAFEMDRHEVTNREYRECVTDGGCESLAFPGDSVTRIFGYYTAHCYNNFPVVRARWYQAVAYCEWAGKRLATEAEWEYAARGGLEGKRYVMGDTITGDDANYLDSGDRWEIDTSPVENYPPNGYGLYDMDGNVQEWVNDRRPIFVPGLPHYYSVSPTNDPQGYDFGPQRIIRGGDFGCDPAESHSLLAVASRSSGQADDDYGALGLLNVGIRCVRSGDCVDEDHDGYGNPDSSDCISAGLDCDDANPEIYPGATEVCDNGADDDCDGLIDTADPDCP